MRPGRAQPLSISRRALGTRLAGVAAAIGFGNGAAASGMAAPVPALDPELRDAALRGLALAGYRGDPVTAAAARAVLARLAETDPEAALLGRLYQKLDVRPAAYWPEAAPEAAAADLPRCTRRHPRLPAGRVRLYRHGRERDLAHGAAAGAGPPAARGEAAGLVRGTRGFPPVLRPRRWRLAARPGDFSDRRMTLLQGLVEKETGRA